MQVTLPDGSTYLKVDFEKTLSDNTITGELEKFSKKLDKQIKGYNDRKGDPQKHAAAIRALEDYAKQLKEPVPVGSCSPE